MVNDGLITYRLNSLPPATIASIADFFSLRLSSSFSSAAGTGSHSQSATLSLGVDDAPVRVNILYNRSSSSHGNGDSLAAGVGERNKKK